jgi:hypothetical protein
MSPLRSLSGLLGIAGIVAVVLFMPRRVPITGDIVHPFLLGDSLALKFAIAWPLLAVYLAAVIIVAGLLGFLGRGRR